MISSPYYTAYEAADYLGFRDADGVVNVRAFRQLVARKGLRVYKVGACSRYLKDDVHAVPQPAGAALRRVS